MSGVAGAVASRIGQEIKEKYGVREIIVENGGDIYADIQENIDISVLPEHLPCRKKWGSPSGLTKPP